ncbi:hypothetical protein AX14_001415 [Amanita brunnescens Koide BX004]|nr:hypothetical protein AX14_001415 [Amanita brunnescens Koide BX004]
MLNYGPQEDAYTLFLEKSFMMSAFVAAIGYGIQVILYGICVLYLWRQYNRRGALVFSRLAYITMLLLLESLLVAASIAVLEEMYIQNRNYPGGPMAWFLAEANQPANVVFYASLFSLTFLSDLLVLWRCWVVWSTAGMLAAYAVLSVPVIVLLSSFVLGLMWTYQSSQPGLSLYSQLPLDIGTAYYATSLGVNVLLTALIILRLLLHRRAVLRILPADYTKHYLSVTTIVVESVMFYSIFALGFIITYAIDNPINQVFMYLGSACQQISGYMIILRVAQGRAWTSNTLAMGTVSTNIRFNPPVPTTQGIIESQFDHKYSTESV